MASNEQSEVEPLNMWLDEAKAEIEKLKWERDRWRDEAHHSHKKVWEYLREIEGLEAELEGLKWEISRGLLVRAQG
jgi:uncharacterized coiled-coil DUF342 family protein